MNLFITGKRGASKTLQAITEVIENDIYNERPLYVYGVNGFDHQKYQDITGNMSYELTLEELPTWDQTVDTGAVLLIDEVQEHFPARKATSEVPPALKAIDKSRHKGLDIICTCQFPQQVDIYLRHHADAHYHIERKKGSKLIKRIEMDDVHNTPLDYHAKKEGTTSRYRMKDTYFGMYKSSEMHTIKARIPKKTYFVIASVILLAIALFMAPAYVMKSPIVDEKDETIVDRVGSVVDGLGVGPNIDTEGIDLTTPEGFLKAFTPVIKDKPDSAPIYIPLQEAVAKPKLMCMTLYIEGVNNCRCYTQQVTRASISDRQCFKLVRDGLPFDHTLPDKPSRGFVETNFASEEGASPSPRFNTIRAAGRPVYPNSRNSYGGIR